MELPKLPDLECLILFFDKTHPTFIYRDKISVYLQRHPRAGEDTHLTSTQELVKIHNMCEDINQL